MARTAIRARLDDAGLALDDVDGLCLYDIESTTIGDVAAVLRAPGRALLLDAQPRWRRLLRGRPARRGRAVGGPRVPSCRLPRAQPRAAVVVREGIHEGGRPWEKIAPRIAGSPVAGAVRRGVAGAGDGADRPPPHARSRHHRRAPRRGGLRRAQPRRAQPARDHARAALRSPTTTRRASSPSRSACSTAVSRPTAAAPSSSPLPSARATSASPRLTCRQRPVRRVRRITTRTTGSRSTAGGGSPPPAERLWSTPAPPPRRRRRRDAVRPLHADGAARPRGLGLLRAREGGPFARSGAMRGPPGVCP